MIFQSITFITSNRTREKSTVTDETNERANDGNGTDVTKTLIRPSSIIVAGASESLVCEWREWTFTKADRSTKAHSLSAIERLAAPQLCALKRTGRLVQPQSPVSFNPNRISESRKSHSNISELKYTFASFVHRCCCCCFGCCRRFFFFFPFSLFFFLSLFCAKCDHHKNIK